MIAPKHCNAKTTASEFYVPQYEMLSFYPNINWRKFGRNVAIEIYKHLSEDVNDLTCNV